MKQRFTTSLLARSDAPEVAVTTKPLPAPPAELERVFFESSCEVGHYEGALLWNSRDDFIRMTEAEADSSAKAWWEIRNISVHGDIAVAHVEDIWAGMRFDTILTMVKHDGAWRVMAKAYRIQSG